MSGTRTHTRAHTHTHTHTHTYSAPGSSLRKASLWCHMLCDLVLLCVALPGATLCRHVSYRQASGAYEPLSERFSWNSGLFFENSFLYRVSDCV